jgi:hypothetical protein
MALPSWGQHNKLERNVNLSVFMITHVLDARRVGA